MKKVFKILPLFMVVSLTACSHYYKNTLFYFDTVVTMKVKYNGSDYQTMMNCAPLSEMLYLMDTFSDAYRKREFTSVYDLNLTNEKLEINEMLYNLLYKANELKTVATYFNPLIGSLSNKWKDALSNKEVLSDTVIQEELTKINNSSLVLEKNEDKFYAQRVGDALIDVGAIAKGYALDLCESFLRQVAEPDFEYIIDAGNSSVLLGSNRRNSTYKIKIKDLSKPTYFKLKDCFISSSGVSEQGVKINGATYSHIINPNTGSAINLYDTVIVVSSNEFGNGALGDVLSTSFMMSSLEEIKETEKNTGVNVLVIKDDKIVYKSDSLKLY